MRVLAFLPFAFQEILMVMDQIIEIDSDNDGIQTYRSSSHNFIAYTSIDLNKDGLITYGTGVTQ
jgi:hypothetical protein